MSCDERFSSAEYFHELRGYDLLVLVLFYPDGSRGRRRYLNLTRQSFSKAPTTRCGLRGFFCFEDYQIRIEEYPR
jgi:hypothetical protein